MFIQHKGIAKTEKEEAIYRIFCERGEPKRKDIEEIFVISQQLASKHLQSLLQKGYIFKKGNGKNITYILFQP